jgi:hypothetical protein
VLFKLIAGKLEEDESEYYVFVFGWFYTATQLVGGIPEGYWRFRVM